MLLTQVRAHPLQLALTAPDRLLELSYLGLGPLNVCVVAPNLLLELRALLLGGQTQLLVLLLELIPRV